MSLSSFFTTQKTQPPAISLFWYCIIVVAFIALVVLCFRYYKRTWFRRLFIMLQLFQLVSLYTWYLSESISLANSLPFYHCRLAMIGLLVLPNSWQIKQYIALLGLGGATFALGYPVFDPYTFPHITSFSFIIGHYCLLVNSLVYLLRFYQGSRLSVKAIVVWTFLLDAFLVGINTLTGGNYGLMKTPPLMPGDKVWLNYIVVSVVLSAMLVLLNEIFSIKRRPILASS